MPRSSTAVPQSIPAPDTTKQTQRHISDLVSHIARGDNHLWQALNSLQSQANGIVGNLSLICYGRMVDRINADPNKVGNGSLWFATDFPGVVYQVRQDPVDGKLKWYYGTGTIWLAQGNSINFPLGPTDAGLLVTQHGYLWVWDGVGPQLTCEIFGPCAAGSGGGTTGGGSTSGGSGGGGTGTGGSGPGSTNPIPPGTSVAGTVGNFTISNTSLDVASATATATFSWTLPTVNASQYAGLQLWIVGGTTVQEIASVDAAATTVTVTIPVPSLGVAPLVVAAITIDSVIGITQDPTTGNGQNSPTVTWTNAGGGGNPGSLANFVLDHQTANSDGSVTGVFTAAIVLPTVFFAGVNLILVATTGSESVPTTIGSFAGSAPANNSVTISVTAPASAVGETWTVAAVVVNTVGTSTPLSQAQTRDWNITG